MITELPKELNLEYLPQHVAVIMDGNGRWAKQRNLPRIAGHRQGVRALKEILRCCKDLGISALTVYAFSTENWSRPFAEVEFLMKLFERSLRRELKEMKSEGIRLNFLGDLTALPSTLQTQIAKATAETAENRIIDFNIAVNYGGRHEIIQACQKIALQIQQGRIQSSDINEKVFSQNLYTSNLSEPDLLIRTSGEMRLSNFLLWQMAYTEMYFTDVLFPDFDRNAFYQALIDFQQRDRRFGGLGFRISSVG